MGIFCISTKEIVSKVETVDTNCVFNSAQNIPSCIFVIASFVWECKTWSNSVRGHEKYNMYVAI